MKLSEEMREFPKSLGIGAVTKMHIDGWADRVAELEAENEQLKKGKEINESNNSGQ